MIRTLALALALALTPGCPRPIPEHLRLEPPPHSEREEIPITDLRSALRAIVGRDPLARSPSLPDPALLESLSGGEPLAAFARQVAAIERGTGTVERSLQQVEDEWRNTAVVPLARGYRLRMAENQMSNRLVDPETIESAVVGLITPLSTTSVDPTLPRRPLEWLGSSERARSYAERWVLTSWLASPAIPVDVIREPLDAPQYDRLRESPIGRLLTARADRVSSGRGPTDGMAALERATALALERAAADRDAEQAAWRERKSAIAEELGDEDPIGKLLETASDTLISDAADDRAAGGALLALAASRWIDRCPTAPCGGVDRVESMQFAGGWDPSVAGLAAIWQVIALKESLDSLEVARETPLFPEVMVDLADALLGTGAGPLDAQLLRKQRPDEVVWLSLSRAVGAEGITDWEGARVALGEHLARETSRAAALTTAPETASLLDRIHRRAIP